MTRSTSEHHPIAMSRPTSGHTLEVVAGAHRGVRLELEQRDYRIGATPASDIVLRDSGIAEGHALLRVGRKSIHVHATGGDVGVGDVLLAKGYGCVSRLPVDLAIGEARLHIDVERPGGQRPRVFAAALAVGAVLFGIPPLLVVAPRLGITVPSSGSGGSGQWFIAEASPSRTEPAPIITASVGRPTRARAPLSTADVEEAVRRLAERLGSAGIRGLSARAAGGHVVVTGVIGKEQAATWTAAQQWFDETYDGRVVIAADVKVGGAPATPVLNVQAVWFGQPPYLITAEGVRYYKGALLNNGWTIKDIGHDRIVLAKAGETAALVYR